MNCKCETFSDLWGEEATRYADEHLTISAKVPGRGDVIYACPNTGKTFLLGWHESWKQGGGIARLRLKEAALDDQKRSCQCKELTVIYGWKVIHYTPSHLRLENGTSLYFWQYFCPFTNVRWISHLPTEFLTSTDPIELRRKDKFEPLEGCPSAIAWHVRRRVQKLGSIDKRSWFWRMIERKRENRGIDATVNQLESCNVESKTCDGTVMNTWLMSGPKVWAYKKDDSESELLQGICTEMTKAVVFDFALTPSCHKCVIVETDLEGKVRRKAYDLPDGINGEVGILEEGEESVSPGH